jgi:hypothetical protein
MKFERRIRALEARMIADPVILVFADGSTGEICGRGDFLLSLMRAACGGVDLSSVQTAQLDLIRKSVYAQEPGGGRMVEMLRAVLPAEEATSLRPLRLSLRGIHKAHRVQNRIAVNC